MPCNMRPDICIQARRLDGRAQVLRNIEAGITDIDGTNVWHVAHQLGKLRTGVVEQLEPQTYDTLTDFRVLPEVVYEAIQFSFESHNIDRGVEKRYPYAVPFFAHDQCVEGSRPQVLRREIVPRAVPRVAVAITVAEN